MSTCVKHMSSMSDTCETHRKHMQTYVKHMKQAKDMYSISRAHVRITHTYIHTCIHTYMHTYIHTYIFTYIYIYIFTFVPSDMNNVVALRKKSANRCCKPWLTTNMVGPAWLENVCALKAARPDTFSKSVHFSRTY